MNPPTPGSQDDRCPECHAEYGGHYHFPPCSRLTEQLRPQFRPIPHRAFNIITCDQCFGPRQMGQPCRSGCADRARDRKQDTRPMARNRKP